VSTLNPATKTLVAEVLQILSVFAHRNHKKYVDSEPEKPLQRFSSILQKKLTKKSPTAMQNATRGRDLTKTPNEKSP
jgi:hypothetical protein